MEDAVGDGAFDLRVRPRRMPVAEACRQQLAHGAVHLERLLQALLRGHGPNDRHLPLVGGKLVIGIGCG